MRRPRRLVLSAAAMGLALAASGCTYLSPVQTHEFYQAGDGTNANITQDDALFAGVRNAVLVFGEDGTPVFTASVVNYSDEEITVDLEGIADGASIFSTQVQVPAQGTVKLGPGEDRSWSRSARSTWSPARAGPRGHRGRPVHHHLDAHARDQSRPLRPRPAGRGLIPRHPQHAQRPRSSAAGRLRGTVGGQLPDSNL